MSSFSAQFLMVEESSRNRRSWNAGGRAKKRNN